MSEIKVGVRDLKTRLSEYLRLVQRGETILITDHGQPVGRILPAEQDIESRIAALQQAGLLAWDGQDLPNIEPPAVNSSGHLISDLVSELREQEE